jgi:hypothetical protein
VLMAVTMYGFRFAVIAVRARRLPGPGAAGRAGTPGAPPASRQPVSGRLQTAHANEPRAGPSRPGSTFV